MAPPSHEECILSQEQSDKRNFQYLMLMFGKSFSLTTYRERSKVAPYAQSFDALAQQKRCKRTGTRVKKEGPQSIDRSWSPGTSSRARISTESEGQQIARAERLVHLWKRSEKRNIPSRTFWDERWGETYVGFKSAQRELGKLRDSINESHSRQGSRSAAKKMDLLSSKLNKMLLDGVDTWYFKWGELDLHMVKASDALKKIKLFLVEKPWKELRIVAGQRAHRGDDHDSEGVLFRIIHDIFGSENSQNQPLSPSDSQIGIAQRCRSFVMESKIEITFYSYGAAVHLRKKRRQRDPHALRRSGKWKMVRKRWDV